MDVDTDDVSGRPFHADAADYITHVYDTIWRIIRTVLCCIVY